ncbi:NAD-dependent succinate-semialdehyde dehydrogenase [Paeniglutamicibacter psychrophenolicus]|uniref:Succinate-semialdehyde dehydrogenase/glutarate-semialdehyde dehydrogenase n=1 Tax=Paeniglutamicibacter psychrophenolicus TaxID=257454 RepID=A0ABS4W7J9_9MICC|nr:NAD-dependent succinate-semialdehyde dehydrogenase [Paeniglutamicibacter psychrophenolicus]MBP2372160.1 succinate-semialdehyde dehydrogenase/glutarate-semialdehyde dehydrogenase [Paeniglutamicibacter psychrophenolicus]
MYRSTNPATGLIEAEFPTLTPEQIAQAAEQSSTAYKSWQEVPVNRRAEIILNVANIVEGRAEELSEIITREMGKPISQSRGEISIVASICRYYGDNAQELLADEKLNPASGDHAIVRTSPIGPILGIMPWNFPFYQVARFAIPNLLLGNTILLKHASNCPQAAIAFDEILHEAGVPADAYINLLASSHDIDDLIASPHVQGVSLTGSEKAGAAVAAQAGKHLKKVVLELGGSDPLIVLDSEKLSSTVKLALRGRFANAGQACVSSKRMIVLDHVFDEFSAAFSTAASSITPGDPMDASTFLGPLYSAEAREEIMEIVNDALDRGAELLVGGESVGDSDAFMSPVVLTGVTPEMRAFREEIFGPVAVLHRARDTEHAIELANDSDFGLGAAIFGSNAAEANAVADRLEAGMVVINGIAGTQADLPFGGIKRSGIGRELGQYGIDEFSNKKLIRVPAPAV